MQTSASGKNSLLPVTHLLGNNLFIFMRQNIPGGDPLTLPDTVTLIRMQGIQSVFCEVTETRHGFEDTNMCFVIKCTDVLYKICSWFRLPTRESVFGKCHWKGARWKWRYFNNIESIPNVYIPQTLLPASEVNDIPAVVLSSVCSTLTQEVRAHFF
jgi:hypothetical protein